MEFEQVMCSDENADYQVECMAEDEEVVQMSSRNLLEVKPNPEPSNMQPVKRKVPIIRKPGEVVTPCRVQATTSTMKTFALSSPNNQSLIRPIVTARIRPEWKKVEPPTKTLAAKDVKYLTIHPVKQNAISAADTEYRNGISPATPNVPETQLDRIERKMDEILTRLGQHEATFGQMQSSIKDIKTEMKASVIELKQHYEKHGTSTYAAVGEHGAARRKPVVIFPVPNDEYMSQLEDLVRSDDDEVQKDLTTHFKTAPVKGVYDFLRYNINALFKNCSKYTWTGKPPNSCPNAGPSIAASESLVVGHLIACATEVFPYTNRDVIAKDFRRALDNFNDARKRMNLRKTGMKEDLTMVSDDE